MVFDVASMLLIIPLEPPDPRHRVSYGYAVLAHASGLLLHIPIAAEIVIDVDAQFSRA
jgi:hypothetical protein